MGQDPIPVKPLPMPPYCNEAGMKRIAELEAALREALEQFELLAQHSDTNYWCELLRGVLTKSNA